MPRVGQAFATRAPRVRHALARRIPRVGRAFATRDYHAFAAREPTTGQSSRIEMSAQENINTKGNEDDEFDKAEPSKLGTSVDGGGVGGDGR